MHRNPDDFDPRWLRFFVRSIGLYPLGTRLELSTGESAIVIGQGSRQDRPRVKLTSAPGGLPLPADAPTILDVGEAHEGVVRTVTAIVSGQRKRAPNEPLGPNQHRPCC